MDILSLLGVVLGLVAILGGSVLKGSGLVALWNPAAFLIVIVGTFGAVLVQVRLQVFLHGMRLLRWVFLPPAGNGEQTLAKVIQWSHVARRDGLLALEPIAKQEPDDFVRKGMQLLVDGAEPETIRHVLEVELHSREEFDRQGARVFESFGVYAPTLGIVGAVMGLIAVMHNLADPSKLGSGIAAAFVATIYGVASANLLFLPVANKLRGAIERNSVQRELVIDGLLSIARGENPRSIETRLRSYLR
ncbi:MAG TPA: flagellar motor protein [Gammaproteobacteria bacterium]